MTNTFDCDMCLEEHDKHWTQFMCANIIEDTGRLKGVTFCEECWMDAEDDCEEDNERKCLIFEGELKPPREWLEGFCRKFCIQSKHCACYSCTDDTVACTCEGCIEEESDEENNKK